MRVLWIVFVLLVLGLPVHTNENTISSFNEENKLFIITLDGLRWQEVFEGADSTLIHHSQSNENKASTKALYWSSSKEERRKKLLPFFWNIMAAQGELYGNRTYNNRMNVANPYALSYPGYNELLTGLVDLTIFGNGKTPNANLSVLDYLNSIATYKGKVAAFASWEVFPFILNKERSNLYINSGFEPLRDQHLSASAALLNRVKMVMDDTKNTRTDEFTFAACKAYVQKEKPSVVFLGFGGTDEAAHKEHYDQYLQQANNADRMIGELWQYLQTLPEYRGKTTFLITTDHGRGNAASNWHKHGMLVRGSSETWMGLLGNNIQAGGEQKTKVQLYQKDIKALMLRILSFPNKAENRAGLNRHSFSDFK